MDAKIQILALFTTLNSPEQLSLLEELTQVFEAGQKTDAYRIDNSNLDCPSNDLDFDTTVPLPAEIDIEKRNARILFPPEVPSKAEHCIECGSEEIIRWGYYNNVKRYKCKSCNRTFTPNTRNIFHGIHKIKEFIDYGELMFNGQYHSISYMSEKLGVDTKTAFDWRHKYLSAISSTPESIKFKGSVEMDDIWVEFNEKGRKDKTNSRKRGGSTPGDNDNQVKVLFTVERKGAANLTVVRSGRLCKVDITRAIGGNSFAPGAVLISDKHASIDAFAKEFDIEHKTFKADEHVGDKDVHVQTINRMASTFKSTINEKMRGVSTKYLQNYANWFRLEDRYKGVVNKIIDIVDNHMRSNRTWDYFSNIEQTYKRFIEKYTRLEYENPVSRNWKTCNWNFPRIESLLL